MRYKPVKICTKCGVNPPLDKRLVCKECYRLRRNEATRKSKKKNANQYLLISGRGTISKFYLKFYDLKNIIAKEVLLPTVISRRIEL